VIIPLTAVLVLVLPGLLGGRLGRLARVGLRHTGWLTLALLAQVFVLQAFADPHGLLRVALEAAHVITYLVAAWFLWENRAVPGLWAIATGALSNGVTIAVNGGTLPARPGALRSAGLDVVMDGFANSAAMSHPRLALLGDIFAIPARFPLANVFSVGDVLIVLGAGIASIRICGTAWTAPWRPPLPLQRPTPTTRRYLAGPLPWALSWVDAAEQSSSSRSLASGSPIVTRTPSPGKHRTASPAPAQEAANVSA
jgi:hypothetical protein